MKIQTKVRAGRGGCGGVVIGPGPRVPPGTMIP